MPKGNYAKTRESIVPLRGVVRNGRLAALLDHDGVEVGELLTGKTDSVAGRIKNLTSGGQNILTSLNVKQCPNTSPVYAIQVAGSVAGNLQNTAFPCTLTLPVENFFAVKLAALNTVSAATANAAALQFRVGVIDAIGQTPNAWVDVKFGGANSPTFSGVTHVGAEQESVLSDAVALTSIPRTDGGTGCLVVIETKQTGSTGGWSYISRFGAVRSADVIPLTMQGYRSVLGVGDSILAASDGGTVSYVDLACQIIGAVPIALGYPSSPASSFVNTLLAAIDKYYPTDVVFAPFSPNGTGVSDTEIYSRLVAVKSACSRIGARLIVAGPCVTNSYNLATDNQLKAIRKKLMNIISDDDYLDLYGLLGDGGSPGRFIPAYYGANNYHPSAAGQNVIATELARLLLI